MRRIAPGGLAYLVAATLVVAMIAHLSAVLLVPQFAERDDYSLLRERGEVDVTTPLPEAARRAGGVPFSDPAVASAFCRFDLGAGPLRATLALGRPGFVSESFHSRRGVVFFTLTDHAAAQNRLEALVVTADQLRALEAKDDPDAPSRELRIVSPTAEGFVFVRAFSESPGLMAEAEARARALSCASEAEPK